MYEYPAHVSGNEIKAMVDCVKVEDIVNYKIN